MPLSMLVGIGNFKSFSKISHFYGLVFSKNLLIHIVVVVLVVLIIVIVMYRRTFLVLWHCHKAKVAPRIR